MKIFNILLLIMPALIFSQVTNQGKPISWKVKNQTIEKITLPEFDLKQIQAEDKANDIKGNAPWRFGYEYQVDIGLNTHGQWTNLNDGSRYWLLNIKSEGAKTMNFVFDEFYLPEGAKLYFYNADLSDVLGAYTHTQNREDKIFGSWLVNGDDIFIEYFEPSDKIGKGKLHLSHAVHGYRSVSDFAKQNKDLNDSGNCNLDVDCSIGDDFDDFKDELKKSVGLTIVNNGAFCSGVLINNTKNDGTPYFLTADHCLVTSVANWAFRFNWRSPNPQCATTTNSTNGTFNQTLSGANLKANNSDSDFALLEITAPIPNTWDLVWAGWDRTSTPANYTVGIHHPSGDIMKVCRDDDQPNTNILGGTYVWWINEWEIGVTESGSSGSPLFNQDGRIVGQLYGGLAACDGTSNNQLYDYYGRFDISWDNGTTSSSRLKDWLDPNNTGTMTLDQYPPATPFDVDAKLLVINTPDEVCNAIDIQPSFIIENTGNDPITSVELSYQMNNDTEVNISWTGNLLSGQSETIASPTIPILEDQNNLVASLSLPNGVQDQFIFNNSSTETIDKVSNYETTTIFLELITDDYGSDTTWIFEDENGQIIAQGGPYADGASETVNASFQVNPNMCYNFTIFDSYQDGICCQYGDGSYTLTTDESEVIFSGGEFNVVETTQISIVENLSLSQFSDDDFKVYPNPAKDRLFIESPNISLEQVLIYDLSGKMVFEQKNIPNGNLDISHLESGVYILKIKTPVGVVQRKLVKE